jgi:hypothetical protein
MATHAALAPHISVRKTVGGSGESAPVERFIHARTRAIPKGEELREEACAISFTLLLKRRAHGREGHMSFGPLSRDEVQDGFQTSADER